jgi:hypothetical protein
VLSVLRLPLDKELFKPFKHLLVEIDDVEDENLLQFFTTTNGFIQEGLDGDGGVLVHWYVVPAFSIPPNFFGSRYFPLLSPPPTMQSIPFGKYSACSHLLATLVKKS